MHHYPLNEDHFVCFCLAHMSSGKESYVLEWKLKDDFTSEGLASIHFWIIMFNVLSVKK